MASNTGENEQALRRIADMSRMIGLVIWALHLFYFFHSAFETWGLTSPLSARILTHIGKTGLFSTFDKTKWLSLAFLCLSLLGIKGKKDEKRSPASGLLWLTAGAGCYFASRWLLALPIQATYLTVLYGLASGSGLILFLTGATTLSRVIILKTASDDIFNEKNQSFPQQEQLIQNPYSVNLPSQYRLKGKLRRGWINFVNPMRGLLVLGSPGSGKTYFIIRHVISQHIKKGFTLFLYDFKYDDLSKIAYNCYLENKGKQKPALEFFSINFDDLSRSHRCNPLDPASLVSIEDAAESARAILMGLNREWVKRQGDFFVESPINFLTAVIWFLRKYRGGIYCSLPHAIELMQVEHQKLFSVLAAEKEIEVLINPFVSAFLNEANQQLEGQIASAQISMARLCSPSLYYILSGRDFTLDINNPAKPKIVCLGNNPQKIMTYGAVISLYVTRLINQVNQKGKLKSSLIFDEFPTIFLNHIDSLIATARQNKVATTLGVQDLSQLRKDYGREQADVIMNITGNIISGQVTGETAKQLSERFGKIMQDRTSYSINRSDTSVNRSQQLEMAIPAATISALSSGEFVGMIADSPDEKVKLKAFHCQLLNDHKALRKLDEDAAPIPIVRETDPAAIQENFKEIKRQTQQIIEEELSRLLADPELCHLVLRK